MGAVLSQNEVDSLLRGIGDDEFGEDEDEGEYDPDEVVPFDLTAQDRIIRGRMPTLEIIHDRFVRLFRLTLSNALRKVVDISVRSTELIKFGEFLKTLPVPSSLNSVQDEPTARKCNHGVGNAVGFHPDRSLFRRHRRIGSESRRARLYRD